MANSKRQLFLKRRLRVRNKLRKVNSGRVRLSVHRSNKNISAQLIDDVNGVTLASAASLKEDEAQKVNKLEQAKLIGKQIAEKASEAGIAEVVFDRNGYLYHGRVKALADSIRENGVKI